jgi:hypothetical protein
MGYPLATPGPWVVMPVSDEEYEIIADAESFNSIASVYMQAKRGQALDNARLVASAPTLAAENAALREETKQLAKDRFLAASNLAESIRLVEILCTLGDLSVKPGILKALRPHERKTFEEATDDARRLLAKHRKAGS